MINRDCNNCAIPKDPCHMDNGKCFFATNAPMTAPVNPTEHCEHQGVCYMNENRDYPQLRCTEHPNCEWDTRKHDTRARPAPAPVDTEYICTEFQLQQIAHYGDLDFVAQAIRSRRIIPQPPAGTLDELKSRFEDYAMEADSEGDYVVQAVWLDAIKEIATIRKQEARE